MTEEELRLLSRRLAQEPEATAGQGDHSLNPHLRRETAGRLLKPAAVLVPVVIRQPQLQVLFTRRADHLARHAGQVSFPGGRLNHDVEPAVEAALRETEEEIGLVRDHVEILAQLDSYETGTGFCIQPFIGIVREGFALKVDPEEVAEVFEVPLAFLMDERNHETHSGVWQGAERRYHAISFGRHYIWGATAGILVNMHKRLLR